VINTGGQFASGGSQFGGFSGVGTYISTLTFTGGHQMDGTVADILTCTSTGPTFNFRSSADFGFGSAATTFWIFANSGVIYPNLDNAYALGAPTRRVLNGLFGTQVGTHDGTRFRASFDSAYGVVVTDAAGNTRGIVNNAGQIAQYAATVAAGVAHGCKAMYNKSGANSIAGALYWGCGAADFSVGAAIPDGDTYIGAGKSGDIWVCVGAGGVADAAIEYYAPVHDGQIVSMLSTGACTRGQFVDITAAGAHGSVDPAAAPTAGKTVGTVLKTTAGAGLVIVNTWLKWA